MANPSYTPVPTFVDDSNPLLQSRPDKMPPPPAYGETVASPSAPPSDHGGADVTVVMDDYEENDEIAMLIKGNEEDDDEEEDDQGSKGKSKGDGKGKRRIRRYRNEQDDECCGMVLEGECFSCKIGFCGFNLQCCGCIKFRMWSFEIDEEEQ